LLTRLDEKKTESADIEFAFMADIVKGMFPGIAVLLALGAMKSDVKLLLVKYLLHSMTILTFHSIIFLLLFLLF